MAQSPLGTDVAPRQLVIAASAAVGLGVAGTGGFVALGESPLDALYRTVNIFTTAGMVSEPPSRGGKVLTIVLLSFGVVLFLYVVGLLLELVVGGIVSGLWQRRRVNARIAKLSGHQIVCGYGRVGSSVAHELRAAGVEVVVIDDDPAAVARAASADVPEIEADGADEAALRDAGIDRAAGLIACADNDAANTFVVLTARGLAPRIPIIARASSEAAAETLRRAGAERVVSPYATAGAQIANLVARPHVTAFLSATASADMPEFNLDEFVVPEGFTDSGRSIGELAVRKRTGATILAVRKAGGEFETRPSAQTRIDAGDVVIGVGTTDAIDALEALLASV